ncbi:hypothetical protein [Desulfosporosinus sp. BICA1-9]|uniref:hypothetical protein n=1 Tax=Desulfosporosinus sp. BICA1-9 TaxID=1531958 RepID=UPI00054C1EA1|nr:hypothetical protein [Desulfosporosinus sp. BICA1-9]KJS50682.1 MAG: hypothetical protein VR66_01410 [Peptococcaceae bacterium BRH_c23]KJS78693.1 MAG: hypothetical protein JL57_31000 [Desulfosporosinus sp. BICA1-9]HBW36027.1 hypothetical protein [Desulfosporosinus sp.]
MKKTNDILWTQIFQDKPIPRETMGNFHTELMAKILGHPVNFAEEIHLGQRRKWGIGLAACLMISGVAFGIFLWLGSDVLYRGLNSLLIMLSGLPYVADLLQVGNQIVQNMLLLRELKIGISLLWGVLSWPLLGILSVIVVFKRSNSVYHERPLV